MARPSNTSSDFWKKVEKTESCWNWEGLLLNNGYGQFYMAREQHLAHRWAYLAEHGAIEEGKVLDHLCRNRRCVRPSHLEQVTRGENVLRGEGITAKFAVATECVKGHPFDEENTQYRKSGGRYCRTCRNRRQREYIARLKERREN